VLQLLEMSAQQAEKAAGNPEAVLTARRRGEELQAEKASHAETRAEASRQAGELYQHRARRAAPREAEAEEPPKRGAHLQVEVELNMLESRGRAPPEPVVALLAWQELKQRCAEQKRVIRDQTKQLDVLTVKLARCAACSAEQEHAQELQVPSCQFGALPHLS
jgi:hypothetical protein